MSSISKAESDEEIGEFWDSHDFTEFDTDAPDVQFEIISTIPIQLELLNKIEEQAARRDSRDLGKSVAAKETRKEVDMNHPSDDNNDRSNS